MTIKTRPVPLPSSFQQCGPEEKAKAQLQETVQLLRLRESELSEKSSYLEKVNTANEISTSSSQVNISAQDLSNLAEQLSGMVNQFKV